MNILFLPLDSRPCTSQFPVRLVEWTGSTCLVPPVRTMDHYTRVSDWQQIRDFLEAHFGEADAAVISIDQLCYGSLIASREQMVTDEEVMERMNWLASMHERYPSVPIYASNTILRTSVSALKTEDIEIWKAVNLYSALWDKAQVSQDEADWTAAKEIMSKIPEPVLKKYHAVRARNNRVNHRSIDFVQSGVIHSLVLLMEDSTPYGFHREEQRALAARSKGDSRISIHNGTDEGGMLTATKALQLPEIPVCIRWLGQGDASFIADYEDRPFIENVTGVLTYLGIREDPDASAVLAIAAPADGKQRDMNAEIPDYTASPRIQEMAEEVSALMDEGRQVYLLDVLDSNGGEPRLLEAIRGLERLCGYSAWNTASNALGTIVPQICSDLTAGRSNLSFRNERFVDDLLYECYVRHVLNDELRSEGEDPYAIHGYSRAQKLLREAFDALLADSEGPEHASYANVLKVIRDSGKTCRLSLPWERTFEVEVHMD